MGEPTVHSKQCLHLLNLTTASCAGVGPITAVEPPVERMRAVVRDVPFHENCVEDVGQGYEQVELC